MNADRLACAAALMFLGSTAFAGDTLETALRTHGPKMHELFSSGPVKESLQKFSAVIQRGHADVAYGLVISADGYLLTKASEVTDPAGLSVRIDQENFKEVRIVSTEPKWDVALLKVEATGLTPVRFATGPEPERGAWVVANGSNTRRERNPQIGVISANAREVKDKSGMILGVYLDDEGEELKISKLEDEGDAKKAGFQEGDVLVSIARIPVRDLDTYVEALNGHPIGSVVEVEVKRDGVLLPLQVSLGEMITRNDQMSATNVSGRRSGFPRILQHDIIANVERMGGPVLNLDGDCIGMNIARANRSETYAIPALELKALADEMLAKAKP